MVFLLFCIINYVNIKIFLNIKFLQVYRVFFQNKMKLHISFYIDGIDPSIVEQELKIEEYYYTKKLREIVTTNYLVGMDIVEVNPFLDRPKDFPRI